MFYSMSVSTASSRLMSEKDQTKWRKTNKTCKHKLREREKAGGEDTERKRRGRKVKRSGKKEQGREKRKNRDVCCLLSVLVTCSCISEMDWLRQLYMLPH